MCIYFYLFDDWFPLEFVFICSISLMYKYLLELIKKRLKVQEKNMSCACALNFDQWKKFPKNHKSIRVSLWLVYNFTENNFCLRLFSEFIQTQKRYPIRPFLDIAGSMFSSLHSFLFQFKQFAGFRHTID